MYDKRINWFYRVVDTFFSIVRVFIQSQLKSTTPFLKKHSRCIVMGNGPSFIWMMEKIKEKNIGEYDLIAVNHMALTSQYDKYKPSIYILCDPAFWFVGERRAVEKARNMYQAMIAKTTWPLQVYIPYDSNEVDIAAVFARNKNITLNFYNKTKFEGLTKLTYWIYKKQWGMPRAQNVLIAALMLSIHSQYKKVLLVGADNDWLHNLWVDEFNRLRYSDFHYYKEDRMDTDRIIPGRLHEECLSLYFTFKGYVDIERYARREGVEILNLNGSSFIDAFIKVKEAE